MHDQAAAQYFRDLPSSPLQQQIIRDQALVASLTREASRHRRRTPGSRPCRPSCPRRKPSGTPTTPGGSASCTASPLTASRRAPGPASGPLARAAETAYRNASHHGQSELHARARQTPQAKPQTQPQAAASRQAEAVRELPAAQDGPEKRLQADAGSAAHRLSAPRTRAAQAC